MKPARAVDQLTRSNQTPLTGIQPALLFSLHFLDDPNIFEKGPDPSAMLSYNLEAANQGIVCQQRSFLSGAATEKQPVDFWVKAGSGKHLWAYKKEADNNSYIILVKTKSL